MAAEIEFEIPNEDILKIMRIYLDDQVSDESYSIFEDMTKDEEELTDVKIYEAAGRTLFNEYVVKALEWYIKENKLDQLDSKGNDTERMDTESN